MECLSLQLVLPEAQLARLLGAVGQYQYRVESLDGQGLMSIEGNAEAIHALLAQLPDYALQTLPQVGPKRAGQIRAMTDWGLLLSAVEEWKSVQVRSPADVANLLMLEMGLLDQEELRIVGLTRKTTSLILKPSIGDQSTVWWCGSLRCCACRLRCNVSV